jgi:hypothetical protein
MIRGVVGFGVSGVIEVGLGCRMLRAIWLWICVFSSYTTFVLINVSRVIVSAKINEKMCRHNW